MTKICPHCQQAFECRSDNIMACDCIHVVLSSEDYQFIRQHYSDCLCSKCLHAISSMPSRKKAV